VAIGLGLIVLAVMPALVVRSQDRLAVAVDALRVGDCSTATAAALESAADVNARPEPFEILAYCDVRAGQPQLALAAIDAAVRRDPRSWELRYGQALVRAAAGRDPRPAARLAQRLNPRHPWPRAALRRFGSDREEWPRQALAAPIPVAPPEP
jgi:Flp pilus assembly protein TadD